MPPLAYFKAQKILGKILLVYILLLVVSAAHFFIFETHKVIVDAKTQTDRYWIAFIAASSTLAILFIIELVGRVLVGVFKFGNSVVTSKAAQDTAGIISSEITTNRKKIKAKRQEFKARVWEDLFVQAGSMTQLPFVIYSLIGIAILAMTLPLTYFGFTEAIFDFFVIGLPFGLLSGFIFRRLLIVPIAKRTRSLGLNPWVSLILLVPFIDIVFLALLIFAPQDSAATFFNKEKG